MNRRPNASKDAAYPQGMPRRAFLQRQCACGGSAGPGGECRQCARERLKGGGRLQARLRIGAANDPLEREADRVADRVMHMSDSGMRRQVDGHEENTSSQTMPLMQCQSPGGENDGEVPSIVHEVLGSPGRALDSQARDFMESRFGYDFSQVRVHTDAKAADSARAVHAHAYTVGRHIAFGRGVYRPDSEGGNRLIAHELAHVVQQTGTLSSRSVLRRQGYPGSGIDPDLVAEREYGGSGAPKAKKCGRPSRCPAGFCSPYRSQKLAEYHRAKNAGWLMAGISYAVDSRVVPLWKDYLWGGSAPRNLSRQFGGDFEKSPTTRNTTHYLYREIKKRLSASPPSLALGESVTMDIGALIPKAVAALGNPASLHQMNFNIPKDIPGNIAGGIGNDQTKCSSGAKPSPFNDERHASGKVTVFRPHPDKILVAPNIKYSVKDTIDLCPGDCGTALEQLATIPLSQFEATGISGDVPFTVDFSAPPLPSFDVPAPSKKAPTSAPAKKPAASP